MKKILEFFKPNAKKASAPASQMEQHIVVGNVKLPLYTENPHEARYFQNPRDTIDYAIAAELNLTGKRVLDLGANIGLTALYYLELGAEEVDAVEPVPDLADRIEDLRVANIHLHRVAISDSVGTQVMFLSDSHNQGNSLNPEWAKIFPAVFTSQKQTNVETTTLDHVFQEQQFDFIKIDVEGVEIQVLEGGKTFFTANRNAIVQIELYDEIFSQADALLRHYFPERHRVVYIDNKAWLADTNSPKFGALDTTEKNPPTYLYGTEFPAEFRRLI